MDERNIIKVGDTAMTIIRCEEGERLRQAWGACLDDRLISQMYFWHKHNCSACRDLTEVEK